VSPFNVVQIAGLPHFPPPPPPYSPSLPSPSPIPTLKPESTVFFPAAPMRWKIKSLIFSAMAAKIYIAYPLFFSSDLQHRDQQVQARRLGVQPTSHQVRVQGVQPLPTRYRYVDRESGPLPTRYRTCTNAGSPVHFPPGTSREWSPNLYSSHRESRQLHTLVTRSPCSPLLTRQGVHCTCCSSCHVPCRSATFIRLF
jgi:hypothetical protein